MKLSIINDSFVIWGRWISGRYNKEEQKEKEKQRWDGKKSILNAERVNLQTNLIISHEHQAFHKILTYNINKKGLQKQRSKQAYKLLSHFITSSRTKPTSCIHLLFCENEKWARSSGTQCVGFDNSLHQVDDIGPLNLNIIEFYITLRNQIHWIEHFSTNRFDARQDWVW